MCKTIEKMIEVMNHYNNGGTVLIDGKLRSTAPVWNWGHHDYDIYVEPTITEEEVTLKANRFTRGGKKVCAAKFSKNGDRKVCKFLMVSNFGQTYSCGLTGDNVDEVSLTVNESCPLWN